MCNYRQIRCSCGHLALPAYTEANLSYTSYCDLPFAGHQKFCPRPTILKRTHDVKVPCINCIPVLRGWRNAVPWEKEPYTPPADDVEEKDATKDDMDPTRGSRAKVKDVGKLRETTNMEARNLLPVVRKRKRTAGSDDDDGVGEISIDAAKKLKIHHSGWTPLNATRGSCGFYRVPPKLRGPLEPLPWKRDPSFGILTLEMISRETVGVPKPSQNC